MYDWFTFFNLLFSTVQRYRNNITGLANDPLLFELHYLSRLTQSSRAKQNAAENALRQIQFAIAMRFQVLTEN